MSMLGVQGGHSDGCRLPATAACTICKAVYGTDNHINWAERLKGT